MKVFISAVILLLSSYASEARCYSLASYQAAVTTLYPNHKHEILRGSRAQAYIKLYNEYGIETYLEGTLVLLFGIPGKSKLGLILGNDRQCSKIVIGPKLHRIITARMAREAP